MTNEAQIKSVALFFSFAFLEDQLARQASLTALYRLNKHLEKNQLEGDDHEIVIIQFVDKIWRNYQKNYSNKIEHYAGGINTLQNHLTDIGPWREFKRMADHEEFLAVLWSQIIGFKLKNLAMALNTTEGTIRHRISRGLRQLAERMI